MGYPDAFSTKRDPGTTVASAGVDTRRCASRTARLAHDASELVGQTVRMSDRSAVQYCISNDLI
jgi:hypothetical protein